MWQPRFENQPILAVAPDRHGAGRTRQTFHCMVVPSRHVRRRPGIATLAVVARPAGRLPPRPTCDAPVTALTSHCPAPSPPRLPAIALLFAPTGVCVPPPRRGRAPRAAAVPLGGVWPSPAPIPLLLCVYVLGSGPYGRRPAPTAAALAGRTVGGVTRHRVCSGTAYASGWRAPLLYAFPPLSPLSFSAFRCLCGRPYGRKRTAVCLRGALLCATPPRPHLCALVLGGGLYGRRPAPTAAVLAGRTFGGVARQRVCSETVHASGWRTLSVSCFPPPLPSTFLPLASFWSPRRSWTDDRLSPRRSALPHAIPSPFVRCCA